MERCPSLVEGARLEIV